jgi:predicted DNA-binding protein
MEFKKATYTLPIEAINQLKTLSQRTKKSKSRIVAELIMNTETDYDKIVNMGVKLESSEKVSLEEMMGTIKTGEEFDPVKIRNNAFLDRID